MKPTTLPRGAVAPAANASQTSGLHPWWAQTAGATFIVGWLFVVLFEHRGPVRSTGTGFGDLWVLILLVAVAGIMALLGLALVPFQASRSVGSIWLAFWGGMAVGVVFGVMISIV
jgi:hypothetical protein